MNSTPSLNRSLALSPGLLLLAAAWSAPTGTRDDQELDFTRDVLPILEASCASCHGAEKQKAGQRLDSFGALMAGSYAGDYPIVVPHHLPAHGRLVDGLPARWRLTYRSQGRDFRLTDVSGTVVRKLLA